MLKSFFFIFSYYLFEGDNVNTKYKGLNEIEVKNNLKLYGLNEIKKNKNPNFLIVFINEFNDWLVIILIVAALISLIVDPNSLFETIIIILILFINATIGAIQEIKAYKTLDGLKKLSNHKVKVIRNNKEVYIEPSYLTINDIVVLNKGNMIDADMKILEAKDLKVDESILTGESILINKNLNDYLFSGTFIVSGNCICVVEKIGMKSKIGEIADEIIKTKEEATPLEIKLAQIGKIIGLFAIFICVIVFFIELALKISLIEAFKSAVSLAVAAIPEGLATVVTVTLAIGVGKMAKENAIIKKLASVETLGCSNIVCTDKTGTLTENKQKIVSVYENEVLKNNQFNKISSTLIDYLYILSRLSEEEIVDPIDKAIIELIESLNYEKTNYQVNKIKEFNSTDKYMSASLNYKNEDILLFKGAFDKIVTLVRKKPNNQFYEAINKMMGEGDRVIAIATKDEIVALIGMQDLPRKDVLNTIMKANTAGLRTIMITGDHPKTAFYIASKLNIVNKISEVMSKEELDKLTDDELDKVVENYNVYARVDPFDKVRIINAWQRKNKVVAMTGDGINDALALKRADIGCAMGSGAEISKECADVILVDSNYNTIIKAIKNGRGIYENIKRCCKYLLSSNIGEVLTILIITLISLITKYDLGIPLLAIHLLWINIITDSLPAFGLGIMESNDEIMKNPPRKKEEAFFNKKLTIDIFFMGIVIGLLTIISYLIGLKINPSYATTMAFLTISTAQLFHSYNCSSDNSIINRKTFKNKFLNLAFIIGMILQLLVIYVDKLNVLFKLKPLPLNLFLISSLLSVLVVVISEIKKTIENKIVKN